MPTAPYPLHPEPLNRSWLERNPLWKIPLGCLTLVLLMAIFGAVTIIIISASFRASDVYKQAISQATASSQVREQIGEPIKPGWFIFGELKYSGTAGHANFAIPISGARGRGRIRVIAHRRGLGGLLISKSTCRGNRGLSTCFQPSHRSSGTSDNRNLQDVMKKCRAERNRYKSRAESKIPSQSVTPVSTCRST